MLEHQSVSAVADAPQIHTFVSPRESARQPWPLRLGSSHPAHVLLPSDTALVEQPVSGARSPHCGSSSRRAGTPAPPPESLLVGGRARRPFSPAPLVRAARVPRSAGEVAGV